MLQVKFNLILKPCLFASLLRLWNICERLPSPQLGDLAVDFGCFCRLSPNHIKLTYRNFLCQYSVMVEITVKRAFAFIVLDSQHGETRLCYAGTIFSAVKINTMSHTSWIPPDCGPPGGEVGTVLFRLFPRPLCHMHGVYSGGNRGGNQPIALHKRANFVIAPTDCRMRDTTLSPISSQSIRVVVIDA